MTKEKAALPGGKTADLARLCIVQPVTSDERRGSKRLGYGIPGAMTSRCVALIPRVTYLAVMWGVD